MYVHMCVRVRVRMCVLACVPRRPRMPLGGLLFFFFFTTFFSSSSIAIEGPPPTTPPPPPPPPPVRARRFKEPAFLSLSLSSVVAEPASTPPPSLPPQVLRSSRRDPKAVSPSCSWESDSMSRRLAMQVLPKVWGNAVLPSDSRWVIPARMVDLRNFFSRRSCSAAFLRERQVTRE